MANPSKVIPTIKSKLDSGQSINLKTNPNPMAISPIRNKAKICESFIIILSFLCLRFPEAITQLKRQ